MSELIQLQTKVMREKQRLQMTVNGEPRDLMFDGYKTLLEVLREDLNLYGTKHGCELGECGACAVMLDGELVLSCLVAGVECQGRASDAYSDEQSWARMSILNCARVGRFSSDRSIRDYCRDIWRVKETRRIEEGS